MDFVSYQTRGLEELECQAAMSKIALTPMAGVYRKTDLVKLPFRW